MNRFEATGRRVHFGGFFIPPIPSGGSLSEMAIWGPPARFTSTDWALYGQVANPPGRQTLIEPVRFRSDR